MPRTKSEIRREVIGKMRAEGFGCVTLKEVVVYSIVGHDSFKNLREGALEYAVQESRILKIEPNSVEFKGLVKKWRDTLAGEICCELRAMNEEMPAENFEIPQYTPEEVAERLSRVYSA